MTFSIIRPIVQAPMAGGPSTVGLAVAVSDAGGLGCLAAGYKTWQTMSEEVQQVRSRTDAPFGVNVFVPDADVTDPADLGRYAEVLAEIARELGQPAPEPSLYSDDQYPEKIAWLLDNPVPVVSFTFGLPELDVVGRLRAAGTAVVLSVSDDGEAERAARLGPDAIVLQGPEAGGHRATLDMRRTPDQRPLDVLLEKTLEQPAVRAANVPVIAAGGVASADRVRDLLTAGAAAVQVGTLFLTAAEAGTRPVHRDALTDGRFSATRQTRAFTGRVARGLDNRFMALAEGRTIVGYPQVHYMTAPLRAAAAERGNPEFLSLWASEARSACRNAPAAEIVRALAGGWVTSG